MSSKDLSKAADILSVRRLGWKADKVRGGGFFSKLAGALALAGSRAEPAHAFWHPRLQEALHAKTNAGETRENR